MFIECLSLCPWGGEDAAVWSLGISAGQQRRGRPVCLSQPQCDWSYGKLQRAAHCWFSHRPSGPGGLCQSSVSRWALSMLSFYYCREEGSSLPIITGRSLFLMQRRVLSDGDMRYRLPSFLSSQSCSVPWYVRTVGDALCWNVETMNESSQKYLDKAATKTRALVPNETSLGKCVPGGVFTFVLMNACTRFQLLQSYSWRCFRK